MDDIGSRVRGEGICRGMVNHAPTPSPYSLFPISAFLKRDIRTARAYRFPFMLQLLVIIFGLVMYFFLGRLVQPSADPALRGYNADYFAFVLVGLAFFNCLYVGMSSFVETVRNEQRSGTLEVLLVCPTSPALTLSGGVF